MLRFIAFIRNFSQAHQQRNRARQPFFYAQENQDYQITMDAIRARLVHERWSGF